jgi:uncharacterized membrane protein HdeD (DUF308 family)
VLRDSGDVASGTPWWKLTKTARQGFMLGAVYVLVGLVQTGEVLMASAHPLFLFLGPLFLALGIAYLASAFAWRRRERSAHPPGQAADP